MFLNDIKEIIGGVRSPLKREALDTCRAQADGLSASAEVVDKTKLFDILTISDPEDFRLKAGFVLRYFESNDKPGAKQRWPFWPSLSALSYKAAEGFGVDFNSTEAKIMLTSASLGEMHNGLPFHGNPHYRKVLMSVIRQISIHNELYKDTEWELGARDVALMVAAANIHDFQHDGKSNGDIQSRLEKESFDKAKPFLIAAGVDEEFLADLEVMVLSTDVNKFGQQDAPNKQMQAAYKHYFLGQGAKPDLREDLSRLHGNPRLCLLSALFQEADLMPSVAFGYKQGVVENMRVAQEVGFTPSPKAMLGFMTGLFGGFLTKAGQANESNYQHALKEFEADLDAGVVDYRKGAVGNFLARNWRRAFAPKAP